MITHTLISKCNTIIKDSDINTGLNPVAELNIGETISRIILNFNLSELKKTIIDNGNGSNKIKHKLHMTNCGGINIPFNENVNTGYDIKKRASSFDIIAFKIPYSWDEGRGYDYHGDIIKEYNSIISKDGSNWFQPKNNYEWDEYGIYSDEKLIEELKKYKENENSVIIGIQHFDYGVENLDIDITDYINNMLANEDEFNGIGLAFSPQYKNDLKENKFVSFFTNHTNTFYLPYLESTMDNNILDNRANFHLGVENKLYFFVIDNGEYTNLDTLPTCTINEKKYEVKQHSKGVYYIDISFKTSEIDPYTILYDTWSNIILNNEILNDIEMEFVVLPLEERISIGNYNNKHEIKYVPQISGINNKEKLKNGEIRELIVDFIEEYSYGKQIIPNASEYRLYVKENDREIDIYPYQPIDRKFTTHTFIIKTNELIPNDYYIDIKTKRGQNTNFFEKVLEFSIVSNVSNFNK